MELKEESLRYLEEHMPEFFAAAVTQAYWGSLAEGHSVVRRDGNDLVEIAPDGSRRVIKPLPPMIKVDPASPRRLA